MTKERDKQVKHHLREALRLMENIPDYEEKKKKTKKERTSFKGVTEDAQDFDLLDVFVSKIFDRKTGTSKSGIEWEKQSIIIRDTYEETRELIAWRDEIEKFDGLSVGDLVDCYSVEKVTLYKEKHQYTVGRNTDIKVVEEHVL